ncbi:winged helix DNA-binding domain-containing protein [bacterium]|nr:winged helix DNA-binding domain-containing protein [bacterium]
MPPETLTTRELNRALLARQLLLERTTISPLGAVNQLAGLQAQIARPPFVALWSRLKNFSRDDLYTLITSKQVVRATWLRATIHLVSTSDFLTFRQTLQPVLSKALGSIARKELDGVDFAEIVAGARDLLGDNHLPFAEIRPLLQERFPDTNHRMLGYLVRTHLPLVMVPSEDRWAWHAKAGFAVADRWLDAEIYPAEHLPELVKRYLAAFGPATPGDMQTWSGLQGLKPIFEQLDDELVTFKDERKRALYDLPDAPRPPAETKVPVRYLANFDNAILGHQDRTRIVADEHRKGLVSKNLMVPATFLVDGFVAGTWKTDVKRKVATLTLTPFGKLTKTTQKQLEREGKKLLRWVEPEAKDYVVDFS